MNIKRSFVCLVAIVAAVCSSGSAEAQLLYSFGCNSHPSRTSTLYRKEFVRVLACQ